MLLSPEKLAVYRFFELPMSRRNRIAKAFNVKIIGGSREKVIQQVRDIVKIVRNSDKWEEFIELIDKESGK
jgi:hypothetical protein